jgi:hypothetical protein
MFELILRGLSNLKQSLITRGMGVLRIPIHGVVVEQNTGAGKGPKKRRIKQLRRIYNIDGIKLVYYSKSVSILGITVTQLVKSVLLAGSKLLLSSQNLSISASKKFNSKLSYLISACYKCNKKETLSIAGTSTSKVSKKYKVISNVLNYADYSYVISGKSSRQYREAFTVGGQKKLDIKSNSCIKGSRSIINILTALDIL